MSSVTRPVPGEVDVQLPMTCTGAALELRATPFDNQVTPQPIQPNATALTVVTIQ